MIRLATEQDLPLVGSIYEEILAEEEKRPASFTNWQRGKYPTVEHARAAHIRDRHRQSGERRGGARRRPQAPSARRKRSAESRTRRCEGITGCQKVPEGLFDRVN